MTRRARLIVSRALLVVAFLLVLAGYLLNNLGRTVDTGSAAPNFRGQLLTERLQATVAPLVTRPDRPVSLTDLPPEARFQSLHALAPALTVYPSGFIDKRVTRIAIAGQVTFWDMPVGGFFAASTIALNAHDVASPGGETFLADSFHHELSSIVRNEVLFNVSDWTAANPTNFTYATMAEYKAILAQRPPVEGDASLHIKGFVSLYGTTSLDNDWNTFAERVFGHGHAFAAEIKNFPSMRIKTRQLLDVYSKLDPRLESYFTTTGLRAATQT